ncbi:hypothetical protein ACFYUK_20300 [Nonomuraea wenchangensis]
MTKLVPFGASVRVVEGVEGLVPLDELLAMPVETREQRPPRAGKRTVGADGR